MHTSFKKIKENIKKSKNIADLRRSCICNNNRAYFFLFSNKLPEDETDKMYREVESFINVEELIKVIEYHMLVCRKKAKNFDKDQLRRWDLENV